MNEGGGGHAGMRVLVRGQRDRPFRPIALPSLPAVYTTEIGQDVSSRTHTSSPYSFSPVFSRDLSNTGTQHTNEHRQLTGETEAAVEAGSCYDKGSGLRTVTTGCSKVYTYVFATDDK